ncbi:hypothetical protein NHJ6243_003400 [Beauveria neobassiana]
MAMTTAADAARRSAAQHSAAVTAPPNVPPARRAESEIEAD